MTPDIASGKSKGIIVKPSRVSILFTSTEGSVILYMDKVFVVKGHPVTINQVIGNRGTTGWSTGPHLHFQINVYGLPVNPRTFMGNLANGVPIEEADHTH